MNSVVMTAFQKRNFWEPWFYAGPYIPSGILYGCPDDISHCRWLIPGFHPDPPADMINIYLTDHELSMQREKRKQHDETVEKGNAETTPEPDDVRSR